jgi:hypothetical protein
MKTCEKCLAEGVEFSPCRVCREARLDMLVDALRDAEEAYDAWDEWVGGFDEDTRLNARERQASLVSVGVDLRAEITRLMNLLDAATEDVREMEGADDE